MRTNATLLPDLIGRSPEIVSRGLQSPRSIDGNDLTASILCTAQFKSKPNVAVVASDEAYRSKELGSVALGECARLVTLRARTRGLDIKMYCLRGYFLHELHPSTETAAELAPRCRRSSGISAEVVLASEEEGEKRDGGFRTTNVNAHDPRKPTFGVIRSLPPLKRFLLLSPTRISGVFDLVLAALQESARKLTTIGSPGDATLLPNPLHQPTLFVSHIPET